MELTTSIPQELCDEFALGPMAERLLLELDTPDFPGLMSGTGGGVPFTPNPMIKKAWRYLHDEIYSLICTKSRKYAAQRQTFSVLTKPLILTFGGLLCHQFGLTATTASSIAALGLAMPLKMSRNAWCRAYQADLKLHTDESTKQNYLSGERRQLIQFTQFSKKLTHENPKERRKGIRQIYDYKIDPETSVPLLVRALHDENADVRGEAAYTLRELGPLAKPAIPSLVEALHDTDVWVRRHAATFFRHFPTDAPDFLNALIEALKDPDRRVREEAADSLGRLGNAARPAIKSLECALDEIDPERQMREGKTESTRLFSLIFYAIQSIQGRTLGPK